MPYSAEISRTNPSCFLFVIDQSGSMSGRMDAAQRQHSEGPPPSGTVAGRTKAQGVADAINRLLQNLVIRCAKAEGVRDYYSVGVLGYGGRVEPAFSGGLAGRSIVPVSEIAIQPARIEERTKKTDDGAGGLVEQKVKFPIWFEPVASGGTPMCQALGLAKTTLETWLAQHPACFPPTVIHITDGESTDGDPTEAMRALTQLRSTDGEVLLFNLHLSANPNAAPVSFPESALALPDAYAKTMFAGASPLTPFMQSIAAEQGFAVGKDARGFVLNGDLALVIQALDIGTRPSNLR
jgi:hypothetical protein